MHFYEFFKLYFTYDENKRVNFFPHSSGSQITHARPLPSPVPISAVCPEAGTATDTMTVLMAVTRGTVPHRPLALARPTSSAVPTTTASPAHGSVTPTMTAGMGPMRTTAVRCRDIIIN